MANSTLQRNNDAVLDREVDSHRKPAESRTTTRLAIVSRLPPPFGGVTVHVARLLHALRKAGIPFTMYDGNTESASTEDIKPGPKGSWSYLLFLLRVPERVVHFHTNNVILLTPARLVFAIRGIRYIASLHATFIAEEYERSSRLHRALVRVGVRGAAHIVCVNATLSSWVKSLGVTADRITVTPAYIAPTPSEYDERNLPTEVRTFLAQHKLIVGSHGWFGAVHKGQDVYGLMEIAQLTKALTNEFTDVGVYTIITKTLDRKHRQAVYQFRRQEGLENTWLIIESPFPAVSLYAKTDVFVRPTTTDGDSVSVRECINFGVRVVASDVVDRPPECQVVPRGDVAGLFRATQMALSQRETTGTRRKPESNEEKIPLIVDVIRRVLR